MKASITRQAERKQMSRHVEVPALGGKVTEVEHNTRTWADSMTGRSAGLF